ncbi:PQQ-binding-like beta-propeller repeat protein, partial [Akkermansiaceae bacterium]|nr:PQQ-binding-like beta-propeller repeat protein [Akkermansiaceae bacterium]
MGLPSFSLPCAATPETLIYDGLGMVLVRQGLTDSESPHQVALTEAAVLTDAKNIKWAAKLGSQAYGNTVIAGGKVYVGTNNESPRDEKQKGDRGVLMAFDEKDGSFLWQLVIPKLGAGKVSDWEYVGLCSSPAIEGDRMWLVTNRGEVICLDVNGMANGNDGPYKDEAKYSAAEDGGTPIEVTDQSADIL